MSALSRSAKDVQTADLQQKTVTLSRARFRLIPYVLQLLFAIEDGGGGAALCPRFRQRTLVGRSAQLRG